MAKVVRSDVSATGLEEVKLKVDSETVYSIVYFDGICNFCNGYVNFLIRHDKKDRLRFIPLQSDKGQLFLTEYYLPKEPLDSFYLVENGKVYDHSTGGLRLFRIIGGWYKVFYPLIIFPAVLRDFFYRILSRNRYRWFGTRESCMVPTPEVRRKFLL